MMRFFATIAVALCLCSTAHAEWVHSEGERLFGPEVSENQACQMAERKAKENALKAVMGERLSSEDMMVCQEENGDAKCDLNQFTWSVIDGSIKGVRNKSVKTVKEIGGYRKCIVKLDVDVGQPKGKPDPGFDMSVQLSASVFRDGDFLKIDITPSAPMYVHAFQWLPYVQGDAQISRIFPNIVDEDNFFKTTSSIPTTKGAENYDLEIQFPNGLPDNPRVVDEYLMIVGTRKNIEFRESYSLEDFNARLMEISRSDSRLIKRAYAVVRR